MLFRTILFTLALTSASLASPHQENGHLVPRHRAARENVVRNESAPLPGALRRRARMNRRADTCGRTNRYSSSSTSSSAAAASSVASFQAAQYVPETTSVVSSSSSTEQAYTPVPEPTTSSSDPEPTTSSSSSSDAPAYTPETTAQAAPTTSTEAAAAATTSTSTSSDSSSSSSTSGTFTGEITFYATGLGSCGITNVDTDYITAVSHELFDSYPGYDGVNPNANPLCGKKINLSLGGKSVTVTATDRCTGCAFYDLDLSPSAFDQLASQDQGRVAGATWSWA